MFKTLRLKNYRNITEAQIDFNPCLNIFIGDNGEGKSNLLEALYLASTGTSFRYAENINLIKNDEFESYLKSKVSHGEFEYDLQLQISASKKEIYLQGKRAKISDLLRKFPVIIFSPESLSAIKEGADNRRQLIDELLINFSPNNAELVSDFKKALRSRNKLLREIREGLGNKNQLLGVLESLNPIFLSYASHLTVQRIKALEAILPDFNNAMQNINRNNRTPVNVEISVEYLVSEKNIFKNDTNLVTELLQNRAKQLQAAEIASGTSLIGPHKHDIRFLYNQNDSRFYCSQGQQRALILSFKMAQIVYHRKAYGTYPVLMLDDVLSELDSEKRQALISFLSEIETQIFITTTDLTLPSDMAAVETDGEKDMKDKCSVFRISGGRINDR